MTGAAGTIGSEVCRQLLRQGKHGPRGVVMFDIAETPLFYLAEELSPLAKAKGIGLFSVVGDVRDTDAVRAVMQRHAPDAVIHAAAMKHVGVCEQNVREAVLTNIAGTAVVLAAAMSGAPARFILVSTDKAVNPTSVMGATKRVAELDVLSYSQGRVVRLVNVRGSQGSLIPLIKRQIAAGGPVALTDERMVRFFMDVDAAAQLAIDAMTMPPKRVYVPVAPERVKIVDLIRETVAAENTLVQLVTIGARPGEKLEEEMFSSAESGARTTFSAESISILPPFLPNAEWFRRLVQLTEYAQSERGDLRGLLFALAQWHD